MILKNNLISKKYIFLALIISLTIFFQKWILSYVFFPDNLSLKIIFDTPSDGYFYFVHLKALSSLEFNNSFDMNIDNLKNLSMPFSSLVIPSLLYSLIGSFSIVIIEFIFIFFYLLTFFLLLREFNLKEIYALTLSLLLLVIPSFLRLSELDSLTYINHLSQILDLRFPRPFLVNIFFYFFIFYLLHIQKKEIFNYKNFIIISLLLSYSLTSFYHFFFIQLLTIIIFLIYKKKFFELFYLKNLKFIFSFILSFLVFLLPFIYFLITSEPEYNERLNLIELDLNKKKILTNYFFEKFSSLEFLTIFFLISFCNFFFNKKFLQNENLNIFYILFISSILSPILFVILSSKTVAFYNFFNLIILISFFYLFFFCIVCAKKIFKAKIQKNNYIYSCLIVILISFYNISIYNDLKSLKQDREYNSYREGISNAAKLINHLGENNVNLLTFDKKLMVWAVLNDVKIIKPLSGIIVPKTHEMIENDLIESLKFLNVNSENVMKFFENKRKDWRIVNPNIQLFFWGRYSASKLKTFENSKDFDKDIWETIQSTTPLNIQSVAIPKSELKRLNDKFIDYNLAERNKEFIDIIVLDYKYETLKTSNPSNSIKCDSISNEYIGIFINKKLKKECKKIF